ncbi:FAD-dependent oxidoreductase [Streptosporangium sp. NPDC006007]|uniref:FAD-dependent oxidoreductase n=1 Tax=Streptosporangium sp. NPDC006007 TaxID=3154575 RepID=UPI0033B59517
MGRVGRVLVVGGGVGGLTTATALAQRGVEVTLVEKQADFSLPGVGLGQPANALRVYRHLGVLDQVLDAGFVYRAMRYFDHDRNLVVEHPFLLGDATTPPVCALTRRRLHTILYGAALRAGASIRMATTVTDLEDTGGSVRVTLSDGTVETADVVAGFDGIRSTTREAIFGGRFHPRPSGYGAWRIQEPRPAEVDAMEFLQGIGSKTGAMPLDENLMYLFHIRREDPEVWFDQATLHVELRERLAGYGSYVAAARDRLGPGSDIVYGPLELLLIPGPWYSGRVVLGGDAAHVVPPHLTQGAAMAAEDGLVLADELTRTDADVEEMLRSYTFRRYARCAFVYTFARQMLDDEQAVHTPAHLARHREDTAAHGSPRIGVSDLILNEPVIKESVPA